MNLVHAWDNRAILKQTTINTMKRSQRDMITEQMIPILDAIKKSMARLRGPGSAHRSDNSRDKVTSIALEEALGM